MDAVIDKLRDTGNQLRDCATKHETLAREYRVASTRCDELSAQLSGLKGDPIEVFEAYAGAVRELKAILARLEKLKTG